ncbi:hypothetical protein CSOJ01_08398 [Colletotrichum sojae]|uniref:Uncharacterized protein n=1 Tax=Colletotrichum sojae TaxID=2175907 RepID=A0A8H6J6S0_9PEZI|nr:hypothetical protein CSOJ01_08398 [Colletotrichum sojae]
MNSQTNTWSDWLWSKEHNTYYCYLTLPNGGKSKQSHIHILQNTHPHRRIEHRERHAFSLHIHPSAREGRSTNNVSAIESWASTTRNQSHESAAATCEREDFDFVDPDDEGDATWCDEEDVDDGQLSIARKFGVSEKGYRKMTESCQQQGAAATR